MIQYRDIGVALVRASARATPSRPPWPDLTGSPDDRTAGWRDWLSALWEDELLAEAITLASPVLATTVQAICAGKEIPSPRVRRAAESAVRYLLRASTRATPFGMFAGVAPAAFASRASVTWGAGHRAAARPDAEWIEAAAGQMAADPGLSARLAVTWNSLSYQRGEMLVLPCQPRTGGQAPSDVCVRISRPVGLVMESAQSPVTMGCLARTLSAAFPDASEAVIGRMLAELVTRRFLVPALCVPMHATDPLSHLADVVTAAQGPASLAGNLAAIRQHLSDHQRAPTVQARKQARDRAAARMSAMSGGVRPAVAVDLRLDLSVTLPPLVVSEAAAAASALARLAPHPHGNPAWRQWHSLFLDRYGAGAIVPVRDVINPDTGIGYPAGYRGSPRTVPPASRSGRDTALLRMAQHAALSGNPEISIGEDAIGELAAGHRPPRAYPHTELRFSLHAATPGDLDRGRFSLAVTTASRQAGTSIGRFLYLLDPTDRQRAAVALVGMPTVTGGAAIAQLSCPPLSARLHNIARAPAIFPVIPLGEHPQGGAPEIPLDDLAVTGDASGLALVSLSAGLVIEPVQLNAVEFSRSTHPLARFLCELPTARLAPCVPFDWGAAAELPFLPRVRYRRSVLRPAAWRILARDLPGRHAHWREWARQWERLRDAYRVPQSVMLGEKDILLGLDLAEPAHLALLRSHLDRNGRARLAEGPAPGAYEWIGGRPHEIVLPLASAGPPLSAPLAGCLAAPLRATTAREHIPGVSRWLYARLRSHPDRQAEILTRHLPGLLDGWPGGPPAAWFLRYDEPEPHLRLRIPLPAASDYGNAARRLGTWAESLRQAGILGGIVLDTYRPEAGRYGEGPALAAAEALFAADSAAVIAQLAIAAVSPVDPLVLTAVSMTDLVTAFTGDTAAAQAWLTGHVTSRPASPLSRDLTAETARLSTPGAGREAIAAFRGGPGLVAAWEQRAAAASTYRAALASENGLSPDRILATLLHLHHARMIGPDMDSERSCLHLARAAALSRTMRARGAANGA